MSILSNMVNRGLFILSLIGLGLSAYLLYSYITLSPIACLDGGCDIVRKSPYSNILGIPVPAIGIGGYAAIAIVTILRTHYRKNSLLYLLICMNTIGMAFSVWFTYAEIFLIKALCMWCVISALLMSAIFMLSLYEIYSQKRSNQGELNNI